MELHRGIGLRGDELGVRVGFDGSEPKEIRRRKPDPGQCRVAVGISTYHEDVAGAYYFNRAILGLVQDCLGDLGLVVVIKDIFDPESRVVPVEERGALEINEEYVLVDASGSVRGRMLLWQVGGHPKGCVFGEDDIICDMFLPTDLAARFRSQLKEKCQQVGVPLISKE